MIALTLISSFVLLAPLAATATPRAPGWRRAPAPSPVVAIQPLGEIDPILVGWVAEQVRSTFAVEVRLLRAHKLPPSAFYRPRSRYRGERVLAHLEERTPARFAKVLGLMARDLSVTKRDVYDWGVFGVAGLSCRAAVISSHRLARSNATPGLLRKRLDQVAVHELGHTFGLPHCPSARCIMNDAGGTIHTVDHSSGSFCPSCRRRLGRWLRDRSA